MVNNYFGGTGYQYNPNMGNMPQKQNNFLTSEEIQTLMKKENKFSLNLTPLEILQSKCSHRAADGMSDSLVYNQEDNTYTCSICGKTFFLVTDKLTEKEVQESVDTILDLLQTTKLLYADLPADVAANYFQIIPLLEKLPKLFRMAADNFNQHNVPSGFNQYAGNNMNTLNMFDAITNGAMFGAYQQPMYGGMPQQFNGMMGQPQGFSNGFGFNGMMNQPQGYAPNTQNFAYTPNQQPAAQPATTPATESEVVVNEQFKA